MKAVVMNGAVVGEESMIAAGAVVTEGMEVPSRHLAAGVPAVVKKELSGRSMEWVKMAAPDYHELSAAYLEQGLGEA
jgi:carbonic anhydrase/acetyltransferase-like protein (isoleucine patch superfamily)